MTNNSTVIRNAWRSHFGLNLVFKAQYSSSVFALLTR
ncbi:DUF3265 domain-containing protein [Vibrio alginolyticus]|nr:DUF3265 domain-containing protein [Vibrio alginolyticus]MCU8120360.1 DUF3265 domain-containing protein [Vibrio vulnificus]